MKATTENTTTNCPICQSEMREPFVALSRVDNKTSICPRCGRIEAMAAHSIKTDPNAEAYIRGLEDGYEKGFEEGREAGGAA